MVRVKKHRSIVILRVLHGEKQRDSKSKRFADEDDLDLARWAAEAGCHDVATD
jgi:hypothetical protein